MLTSAEVITGQDDACPSEYTITRTWSVSDCAGNETTHIQVITVEDDAPPSIDIMAVNQTVECDGNGNINDLNDWLASNGGASASDNCSAVTWTNDYNGLSDICGAAGSATVTFTATDECGNASTTQATFTIEDTIAPTIGDCPSDLVLRMWRRLCQCNQHLAKQCGS